MSKGLEALNVLYEYLLDEYDIRGMEDIDKNKNIIENALKRLEELEEEKQSFDRVIEKKLKALEIIKTKKVNVNCIISGWSLGKYNSYKTHINLTQEEYDLLKEVLL